MSKKTRQIKALQDDLKKPLSWEFSEHEPRKRSLRWYIIAGVLALGLIVWGMLSQNFMFSLIIVLAAFIIYLLDNQAPLKVRVSLKKNGVQINDRLYDYHQFRGFYIIYKPEQDIKNLYMDFKGVKPRFAIPLGNVNPILVRDHLLKYLTEDLERTEQPLSEGLANLLQL